MITTTQRDLAAKLLKASGGNLAEAQLALQQSSTQTTKKPVAAPTGEVIVRVSAVEKQYKIGRTQVSALRGVDLEIHKGEFVAITGTSGSGKSTLLQLIGGLDKPSKGTVAVAGQDLSALKDAKLSSFRNRTIGFVFQFFYLQPFLNLQTNIEVPAMFARTKRQTRSEQSAQLAAQVDLSDRLRHLPRELSGGQMQRAAIARALQNNPQILLADEPTGNLDRTNALAIFDLFRHICTEQGTTIVVVTHDLSLAATADRTIEMSDGAVT
jgi:ABC-type lipoprotein export system ATPase subunit